MKEPVLITWISAGRTPREKEDAQRSREEEVRPPPSDHVPIHRLRNFDILVLQNNIYSPICECHYDWWEEEGMFFGFSNSFVVEDLVF